ncbi:MAG: SPOR domain-containing protein [bacterium]
MRTAIGLAVSGREIRLARLGSHKGQVSVLGLDTVYLDTSLEYQTEEKKIIDNSPNAESKDVFGLKDDWDGKAPDSGTGNKGNKNLEILYKFLFKYVAKRTKIALNIPVSMARYQRLDSADFNQANDFPGKPHRADSTNGQSPEQHLLKLADGATISLTHDQYPPFLNLLREVNDFLGKKLHFGTMDATELALVNIARANEATQFGKITVIIYVEDDFTRLIFLEGKELLHVSSIINENAASPKILDIISRRLNYELDEANIPEIHSILLAGRSNRIHAKSFFKSQFENANVDFLSTDALGHLPVENEQQHQTFSEYAVALGLAWKQLQPHSSLSLPLNLIPQDLKDQQEIVKLDRIGYALLAITGLVAFFFTFQIMDIRGEVDKSEIKYSNLEAEIKHARNTVDQVLDLDDERQKLEANLSLADSLAKDHQSFLLFLKKLNASARSTGGVWINEINKTGETYSIKGASRSRQNIPKLADKLGGAVLNKVTREKSGKGRLYRFTMDGIEAGKNDASSSEGLSLANFTTMPHFTRELFAGNIRTSQPEPVSPQRNGGYSNRRSRSTVLQNGNISASAPMAKSNFKRQSSNNVVPKSKNGEDRSFRQTNGKNHIASNGKVRNTPPLNNAKSHLGNGKANHYQNGSPNRTNNAEKPAFKTRSLDPSVDLATSKRYYIQVMSSYDRNFAERFAKACSQKGLTARIATYYNAQKKNRLYRVLLGNYPSQANAKKAFVLLTQTLGAKAMKNARIVAMNVTGQK